jgi:rhamnogalacturonan endolyase
MLPSFLRPCFWEVDASRLGLEGHEAYCIERILEFGDDRAIRWLKRTFPPEKIAEVVRESRAISRNTASLWGLYLEIPKEEIACFSRHSLPGPGGSSPSCERDPMMLRLHPARNLLAAVLAASSISPATAGAPRRMEDLGRGTVAVHQGGGKVFVGWRLLGGDPEGIAFNLYRSTGGGPPVKLNGAPLLDATCFLDPAADLEKPNSYFVRPVTAGVEGDPGAPFALPAGPVSSGRSRPVPPAVPYLSVPLRTPPGYAPNDASAGDLDGDGEYEIVLHQAGAGRDNAQDGPTDPPILEAYEIGGEFLWRIDLGRNIREGAHYTQFLVYDLDGDGRAEVACKTADGTVDGAGKTIGDAAADHRNPAGRILAGPEFLTVFDGRTGRALATRDYVPSRHPEKSSPSPAELKAVWGDDYGNRCDRFLACIACLDGERPSAVFCRGYYTRTVLAAWDFREGALRLRWTFDSDAGGPGNRAYAGQGNHNLSAGDVDGDGRDEIVYGGMAIDDDGKGLYSTGLGHGDAMHLADIDPARPGLEVFRIQEPIGDAGAHLLDARTGEVLWRKPSARGGRGREGPGRGLALDVDPRYPGMECWVAGGGIGGMFDAKGNRISDRAPACNMGVYWDGDFLREILDGTRIDKWDNAGGRSVNLLSARDFGCAPNNGTKSNPCLAADILGDWREEVIWRTADNRELRIFTTTIPTDHRLPTLMHDPLYRLGIAWQNVAYNQPAHTGSFIGEGMKPPPRLPAESFRRPMTGCRL